MIVLGINGFGYNPSACLVRDGKLTAFCQEERLNRLKGSHGLFPTLAVSWCLTSQGVTLQDVDFIAFSWGSRKYPWRMLRHLAKERLRLLGQKSYSLAPSGNQKSMFGSAMEYVYSYSPGTVCTNIRDNLRLSGHKGPIPPIEFVDHHVSHAFQTFYQSAFDEASVLIADGSGEENCVSGFAFDEKNHRQAFNIDVPQSLGWYFSGFTSYLGFKPIRDEGKMMGLAAYGESRKDDNQWFEVLDEVLLVTGDGFALDPTFFKFGGNEYHPRFTDKLVQLITAHKPGLEPVLVNERVSSNGKMIQKYLLDEYVDLAFAVQSRLEDALVSVVNMLIRNTGSKNLCLAGGVFMNCKANCAILEKCDVDRIFIHPASSDDGSCLGAAFYVSKGMGYNPRNPLKNVQLGPSFSNTEVEEMIRTCKLSYTAPNDICLEVARLATAGKVVGWFQGGSEMGARALGGRSIVASPMIDGIKAEINKSVKRREAWRPYCPSLLCESREEYLQGSVETPFMILARQASEDLMNRAPDTVHIDQTVRPQTVEESVSPRWYRLIKKVGELTGDPVLLNTSLNVRGEPMACHPFDALGTLFASGLDALAIEDFLIQK